MLISGNSGNCKPYLNELSFLYTTLINKYGFTADNIYILQNWGFDWDFDGDWINDSDYAATRANIFAVFDTLDFNKDVDENDLVLVYVTDHGWNDGDGKGSYMNLINQERLYATEMDSLFTNLEDQDLVNYWPNILAVFSQCRSGGFLDSLSAYSKRAVCSAAKATEGSSWDGGDRGEEGRYKSNCYTAFSYYWIAAMNGAHPEGDTTRADTNDDGYVSFKEAFKYAEVNDEYADAGSETPQYVEYGKGYGSRITLDGDELPILWAGMCRADPGRAMSGGEGAWGDGGSGSGSGSGIKVNEAGGLSPGVDGKQGLYTTAELYARVHNSGTMHVNNILVRFYYGTPSTIASAADTSLHYVGSASWSYLAPGDTALVGPVLFMNPGMNCFGQPHWKIFATMEANGSPIESGWLTDDFHVGIENYHKAESMAGEPMELRFRVSNPETQAKRIVLSLARNTLPEGWQLECYPALGETLDVAGRAEMTAVVTVRPDGIHGPTGVVTIEEELLNPFAGCDSYCQNDSIPTRVYEGGFIMTTGGISFEVKAPYEPTEVTRDEPAAPSASERLTWKVSPAYPNPSGDGVSLDYSMPFKSPVTVTIFDVAGRLIRRSDLGTKGPGTYSFTWDGTDMAGRKLATGIYLLRFKTKETTADQRVVLVR
ncbi:MAG: FlgD immunoglobulin-like domain containing protein [Candidatus Eisenbacteria bacterium]|nr:FlgD immunoglobulin-like domain containing protein [Candidatus Eisenbacteria bacterium]